MTTFNSESSIIKREPLKDPKDVFKANHFRYESKEKIHDEDYEDVNVDLSVVPNKLQPNDLATYAQNLKHAIM